MSPMLRPVLATALGATAMYLLDPAQGYRRRAALLARPQWPPVVRVAAGGLGAWLLLTGARGRGPLRLAALAGGTALLTRSVLDVPLRALGTLVPRGIDVHKTLEIAAPVARVYDLLSHYENFPLFMRNVRRIEVHPDGTSRWTVAGPAGARLSWDAETTQRERNRLIAWRSLPGSQVEHEGVLVFSAVGQGSTRLGVRMTYRPPAGALGHRVARLFGADPGSELDQSLWRLKALLEAEAPLGEVLPERSPPSIRAQRLG